MTKKIWLLLFTLILFTGGLAPLPVSAGIPDPYYVSPTGSDEFGDGSQTWYDLDNSTDWSAGDSGPWLTIKHAVDTAAGGSTIKVAAGTYKENIIINRPVTLLGPNAGIDPNTGLRNPEAVWQSDNTGAWPLRTISLSSDGGPVISDITIKGFSFTGRPDVPQTAGIVDAQETSKGKPVTTNEVIIENNTFSGFANGVKSMGIYKTSGSAFLRSSGWQIRNNHFENFAEAAAMQIGSLTASAVTGNVFLNTCGGIDLDRVDNLLCSGNTLTNIVKKGINLASPSGNVTISNNRITNANTGHYSGQGGIALWVSDFTGPVSITENTVTSCWNAVAVDDNKGDLSHNYVHINNNHFSNNTNLNIYLPASATGILDCTGNWFGTADEAGVAAAVSAGVDYSPWWGADYVADAHLTPWTWHTSDSIQAAIEAAADGDTIAIAAGTYDENIDINRRITLQGAGTDNGSGTVLQNTVAPDLIKGSPYSYKPVIIVSASGTEGAPIVLKNLLIRTRQDKVSGAQLPGILPRPGTTVSWLELDNIRISGTRSAGTAESGLLLDDFSSLDHLVVQDCTFENMAYGIIFFNNSNTGTNARYIEINRSTLNRNSIKGFYAEKLSDAIFSEVAATDNGDTALSPEWADSSNSGIDINLKYGDYANITFQDLTVTGNGMGSENGAGLKVKARGTGQDTSYSSRPATLSEVTITGGTFTGNQAGIRFGEPGKDNTGPDNISVSAAAIYGNLQHGISNTISGETIAADGNWWGTTDGTAISAKINGDVAFAPWHLQKLSGLAVDSLTQNSLVLRWTAGGIWKGDYYDFRFSTSPLDNAAAWEKAERLAGKPVPADGVQEMLARRLKENTRYYFGLASVSGNMRSETAYIDTVTLAYKPVDNQPPAAVTDLAPAPGAPAATSVVLNWTAVGDDGNQGFAAKYIIKQSNHPIDAANFDGAASVYYNQDIRLAGQTETLTVTRLQPGTRYYFALKVQDEANNTSPVSNLAEIVTADVLPAVTGITPGAGENSETRTLTFHGVNFTGTGTTIVRLVNNENVLTLKNVALVSTTELTAVLPKGGPPGIYSARVTNSNGTSETSIVTYDIEPVPQSMPVVTNVVPGIAPAYTPIGKVHIYGQNLAGASAAAFDDHAAAIIARDSDDRITVDVPVLDPGEYDIRVTTAAGMNEVSSVRFSVIKPVVLDDAVSGDVTTSGVIELTASGIIPVQVTMTTGNREEVVPNTARDADISVVIPPGTLVSDASGIPHSGALNPPRVVKPDAAVQASLPGDAIVIEMGNPQQTVVFNRDFAATVTITTAPGTAPSIYYYNKIRKNYELAGKTGTLDDISYVPGGIILNQANGTYTIGLLLDHMSVYVVSTRSLLPPSSPATLAVSYLETDFFGSKAWFSLDINGKFPTALRTSAADGRLVFTLPAGTLLRDKNGLPLSTVTAAVNVNPPTAPPGSYLVGPAYTFGPAGAVINPAGVLVYDFSHDTLSAGTRPVELTWAFYEETTGSWVKIDSTVDTVRQTITAEVTHFTTFTVLAARPAVFTAGALSISPSPATPGQPVTIKASVANTGNTTGSHTSVLRINGLLEAVMTIDLAAGSNRTITFTVTREIPGDYQVELDGLAGMFTVAAVQAPAQASCSVTGLSLDVGESRPGADIRILVQLANTGGTDGKYPLVLKINGVTAEEKTVDLAAGENRTVVFTVSRDDPGTYLVEAGGKTTNFTVSGSAGSGFNRLLIAVGIAILVMVILVVRQLNQRRHISKT